jgi:photosystem II stability/assembly factor-like uncharacterized protein
MPNAMTTLLETNNKTQNKKYIMTTKILITAIILTVHSTVFGQWTQIQSGTSSDLKDVHFPTNTVGYAVGDYGIVLKSVDSGNSWQTVFTDSLLSFTSVFFTSVDTGYATAGNLYKTTNAGMSWSEIITDTFGQIGEVYFVNSNLGFASGTVLHRTTDAGSTWTSINLNNTFSSIHFPNDSVGYFIGGPGAADQLYKTTDGGQNFAAITNGFQSIKEATYFLNSDIGYLCGWYGAVLAKTLDGGSTWQQVDTSWSTQCWDVHFIDENIGYYIDNSGGNYKISNTIDGGATWTSQLVANGVYLNAFYFVSSNLALAVGNSGTIYKTNNGGSVGILEEKKIENVAIYPNPFSTFTTMKLDKNLKNGALKIYNLIGQQVAELNGLNGQTITLYRDNLQNGMYLVQIIQDKQIIKSSKIIIND